MTHPSDLVRQGLQPTFVDAFGIERHASEVAVANIARVFRGGPKPSAGTFPLVVSPDQGHRELVGTLVCEDGRVCRLDGWLPPDVPLGYHRLTGPHAWNRLVVVVPRTFPQPERGWGFAVQLYSVRSESSWGIGDFGDLEVIARRAASDGASTILISPLHAGRPGRYQPDSPYSPASRLFINLCHIDPDRIPGADLVDLSDLGAAGRALNGADRIDRSEVYGLKLEALKRVWVASGGSPGPDFEAYVGECGEELASFSVWSVLAETFEGPWWVWPEEYRRPDGPAVAAVAEAERDRVRFWSFCQWVAERQFAAACSQGVAIVSDLAVGFDAGGFDGWLYQDLLAFDFEIGCPPDRGNPDGQRWGVVPFDPVRLAAENYAPFTAMVRAGLRHGGALRVDHVMGLWRLFWIPTDGSAQDGCYIRHHGDALLGILRLEAARAGAWIVGEDMGTVEDRALELMAETGMLSYRVSMRTHPDQFPERAMVACQTHDQPTIAGVVDRSDIETCFRIGKAVNVDAVTALRTRIAALARFNPDAPVDRAIIESAIVAMYEELAGSRARIALITFDDLAGVSERPNIPGIVDAWPNWKLPLPVTIDELFSSDLARRVIDTVRSIRADAIGQSA